MILIVFDNNYSFDQLYPSSYTQCSVSWHNEETMAQIYLVRHGQASFGSQNYDQLSDLGQQQAQHLGRWWAQRELNIGRIVTGGMQRHQQTALACISTLQSQEASQTDTSAWHTDADFNEYNHHEVLARHVPEFDDPAAVKHFLMHTPNGKQAFQDIFSQAVARWVSGQHDADYSETWRRFKHAVCRPCNGNLL
jgi:broad specificity phosphatase PhoE